MEGKDQLNRKIYKETIALALYLFLFYFFFSIFQSVHRQIAS